MLFSLVESKNNGIRSVLLLISTDADKTKV